MAFKKSTEDSKNELDAYFEKMELASAPAWRPEVNESIFGEIVGFRIGQPKDEKLKPYPIIIVKTEFGNRALHAFHTLMRMGFEEIKAAKGMRIACTYKGIVVKSDAVDIPEDEREKTDSYHHYFIADLSKVNEETVEVSPFA
jgi:hypothetical protein